MNILQHMASVPPDISIRAWKDFRCDFGSEAPVKGVIFGITKFWGIGSPIISLESGYVSVTSALFWVDLLYPPWAICCCMSSFTFLNCSCWQRASSNQWWVSSASFWSISLSLSVSSLKSRRSSSAFLWDSSHSSSRCAWSASAFSLISSFCHYNSKILCIICWRIGPSRVAFWFQFIIVSCWSISLLKFCGVGIEFYRTPRWAPMFWLRKV